MRNKSYLRFAAAAVFLAAAAYGGAAFLSEAEPKPVIAVCEAAPSAPDLALDGTVFRSETVVSCGISSPVVLPREGEYVTGGSVLCIADADGDAYFALCDEAGQGAVIPALARDDGISFFAAPCSGYFSSYLDGFEGAAPEDYPSLKKSGNADAVGRIVYGASWYFAASCGDGDFREGQKVTLTLKRSYPATVQSVHDGTVILRVREGLYSVLYERRANATVSFPGEGGIVLPLKALHGGKEKYVYTVSLGLAKKVPVEVLYTEGDSVTVRSDELRVGMEVVVSGENIHEGRVIER